MLKKLSRQRVGMLLQPGDVWVVEYAVKDSETNRALIHTCQLRGWVEILHNSVPTASLTPDASIPPDLLNNMQGRPIWRLTDSGWAAIQRRHEIALFSVFITLIGVALAVAT